MKIKIGTLLMEAGGSTSTGFESNENGTLVINFSNGQRLTILDSSSEYQSYDITRPGQTIIV